MGGRMRSRGNAAMTWVQLRIGLPEGSWVADVSRANPNATLRTMGVVADEGVGSVLLSVTGPEREPALDAIERHEGVDAVERVGAGEFETTLHVTGDPPRFVEAARRSGLPIEPPVDVIDGGAELEVVGNHDRLSALGRQLAKENVSFDVEFVGRYGDATRVLTDTQRELVLTAIEAGYYDTPRKSTLTEVAERHGIAKSTCSETLQRAEERLMKRFVDSLPHARTERSREEDTVDRREVVA